MRVWLVAPIARLLEAAEVVAECGKDRSAVGALYVANEGVRPDETVARVLGDWADDPTKDTVVNRARAQLDQTF